ncbi:hypothetical protein Tsubulata_017039 [Turnera subulata]|uniref:YqaJ viral recombinase domain-containing protein n=1 Tax=Turnera subulata TaxID=218843 RepID=A0A9Q0F3S8_9ROSI|nr:hypothetical protein Tsubulata_017039 [Turnera subulata]
MARNYYRSSSTELVSWDDDQTHHGTPPFTSAYPPPPPPPPSDPGKNTTAKFAEDLGATNPVLQASSLQHWFKNWQEKRRHKLTASTFAAAVGFWKRRRTQLWLEKIGAIEPFAGCAGTWWTNVMEEEALQRYKVITGNSVLLPEFQVYGGRNNNPEDSWLAASPDGVVVKNHYELPCRGVLEIKCPYIEGMDMETVKPWRSVPLHCIPQAQGLMEILDRDWMDLYVWTPAGSTLFRLYRDTEYWDALKMALSDFWWKHVVPAREICSIYKIDDPLFQLKEQRPASKHEDYPNIVRQSIRFKDLDNVLL